MKIINHFKTNLNYKGSPLEQLLGGGGDRPRSAKAEKPAKAAAPAPADEADGEDNPF